MIRKQFFRILSVVLCCSMLFVSSAFGMESQQGEQQKERVQLSIAERTTEVQEPELTEVSVSGTQTQEDTVREKLPSTSVNNRKISAIDVSDIVEASMPSIVAITGISVQEIESYFYGKQEIEAEGAGSGIIIAQNDTELLIATNNHVVEDTTELTVCFTADADDPDDLLATAVVKGTSTRYDLAVIAVNIEDINPAVYKKLKVATLGSSADLRVGQAAIVIGNALGVGQTVTCGIISALEREITTEAGTFTELQTDAAINFGCSGGAILNAKGEVIGITSAKATTDYAESMGYAIPIDTAVPVLEELINRETRSLVERHGYLGITVVPVSEEATMLYGMPEGAYVYEVGKGSAAEAAGIMKGNIITKFDGIDIDSSERLVSTLGYYGIGETVTVEVHVQENGVYAPKNVQVTLQAGTEEQYAAGSKTEDKNDKRKEKNPAPEIPEDEFDEDIPYYYFFNDEDGEGIDPFEGFGQFFFGDGTW